MAKKKIYKHHQRVSFSDAQADAQSRELVIGGSLRKVGIKFQDGNFSDLTPAVNVSSFGSLTSAISTVGATELTLLVNSPITVSSNTTIPTNVNVSVLKGGTFAISSGVTLTMPAPDAGEYTIFTGLGNVLFTKGRYAVLDWFGADPTGVADSTTAFIKIVTACANIRSFCIPIGTYDVTGLDWSGMDGYKVFGYGKLSVIQGDAAGGTAILTLGDAAPHVIPTRDCKFSDFYITAAGTVTHTPVTNYSVTRWTYGIRARNMIDCHFDGVFVEGDTIDVGAYYDYSYENQWFGGNIQTELPLELGEDNVNLNLFSGVRFRSNRVQLNSTCTFTAASDLVTILPDSRNPYYPIQTGQRVEFRTDGTETGALGGNVSLLTVYWIIRVSDTTFRLATNLSNAQANTYIDILDAGVGINTVMGANICAIVRGQNNTLDTCDFSSALYNVVLGSTRSVTLREAYMEGGLYATFISVGLLGGNTNSCTIDGGYLYVGVRGIACFGGQSHTAFIAKGIYFRDITLAVENKVNFVNPEWGPNTFDNVTTRYTRAFPHDHCLKEDGYRQAYNRRVYTVNIGDVGAAPYSGSGVVTLGASSVDLFTGGKPGNIEIILEGRDTASVSRFCRLTVGINDDGTLSHWAVRESNGDYVTGVQITSGALEILGPTVSNWNAQISTGIWED